MSGNKLNEKITFRNIKIALFSSHAVNAQKFDTTFYFLAHSTPSSSYGVS